MQTLSATLNLRDALARVEGMTEVTDESGQSIGFVISSVLGRQLQREHEALYANVDALFPEDELEKARNQTTERPMAEVMKLVEQS